MKFARFELHGRTGYGILDGEKIEVLWGTPFEGGLAKTAGEVLSLPEVTLLAPCEPTKIVAIGLNYRDHAAEIGHPLPKNPDLPEAQHRGDRSGRGHRLSRDEPPGGLRGGAGGGHRQDCQPRPGGGLPGLRPGLHLHQRRYGPGFTAEGRPVHPLQELRHLRPPGPWIETEIADPARLTVECYLNGERRQHSNTGNLVFPVAALVPLSPGS